VSFDYRFEMSNSLLESDSSDSEPNRKSSSLPFMSCGETDVLTPDRVVEFFQLASSTERTISVPPCQPKGGEVYLYVPESSVHNSKLHH